MVQCLYCETDTAGNHQLNCPNRPDNMDYSGLPKVTDTPPMPKVKDPKPEDNPLPRKEVISIQPGDVIVYRSQYSLSEHEGSLVQDGLEKVYPGHPIVVLDRGATLEVYREQEKAEDTVAPTGNPHLTM